MHMQLALALLSFLYSYEESVLGQRDWSSLERVLWMKSTMRRSAKAIMRTRKGAIIYVAVAVKEKKKVMSWNLLSTQDQLPFPSIDFGCLNLHLS